MGRNLDIARPGYGRYISSSYETANTVETRRSRQIVELRIADGNGRREGCGNPHDECLRPRPVRERPEQEPQYGSGWNQGSGHQDAKCQSMTLRNKEEVSCIMQLTSSL